MTAHKLKELMTQQIIANVSFGTICILLSCSFNGASAADFSSASTTSIRFVPVSASNNTSNRGTPPSQGGTGSRGGCIYKDQMPPLTPVTGRIDLELTTSEYPVIWIYSPYSRQDAPTGEFSLQDGNNEMYRIPFSLPKSPGIIGISLQSSLKPLELQKSYRWYFDINCSATNNSKAKQPASATGLVRRISVSPDLQLRLNAAKTSVQRVDAYASHGIWYDAVTELAQLNLTEASSSTTFLIWTELLSDPFINLKLISKEPIIGLVK